MNDSELARRNNILGLWLLFIAVLILTGTVAVAFIYLAAD
jgi:hypothetical protein